MRFKNHILTFPNNNFSVNKLSSPVDISQCAAVSIQVVINATSALSGTFWVQGTNVENLYWANIESNVKVSVTGINSTMFNLNAPAYNWIRISWIPTAGTATLRAARISKKEA